MAYYGVRPTTAGGVAETAGELSVGAVIMNRAYVGSALVHERNQTQTLTLTSAEDLNLATWLGTQGVDPAVPIIINFASDQTIGSTNKANPALDMGDLSAYTGGITLNVDGRIEGAREGDAIWTQQTIDIINGGTIAGAIEDGIDTPADSLFNVVISSTGFVGAGGGNGGAGGKGGNGESYQRKAQTRSYQSQVNQYGFGCHVNDPVYGVWWDGSYIGIGFGTGLRSGSYGYSTDDGPIQATCDRYGVGRGPISATSGGAGGAGGLGAGYTVTRTDGAGGAPGGTNAGAGGKGGNGGDWGVAGLSLIHISEPTRPSP